MLNILGSSSYGRCLLSVQCAGARDRAAAAPAAAKLLLVTGAAAAFCLLGNPRPGICELRSSICSVVPGRGRGYEYLYPSSWKRDKVRGIELLAHDPEAKEFNLTITSGPAQFVVLGSPEEVGRALLARYQTVPDVEKAELLKVDSFPDRDNSRRSYTLELRILANNELRHFLFKILKTESKVYTLVLQVPEGQWPGSADCARTLLDGLSATTN